jgi:hypothetical protein
MRWQPVSARAANELERLPLEHRRTVVIRQPGLPRARLENGCRTSGRMTPDDFLCSSPSDYDISRRFADNRQCGCQIRGSQVGLDA